MSTQMIDTVAPPAVARKAGNYVLITPARNEETFIELTLRSVIAQTIKPLRWVIVSDGSTDRTDDIVRRYASEHPWIELVRMPERRERHFAGKVHAFNAGLDRVKNLDYEFIGSMDADITFDPEYFTFLIGKLNADPSLGLVGTPFTEDGKTKYDYKVMSLEHVSGACQFFRRPCFNEIGGYTPMKGGGVDHVAVISARMHNWGTRTFLEKTCAHHRRMGTAKHGALKVKYEVGKLDYALGGHPLWELVRVGYQFRNPPIILGGIMILFGYFLSAIRRSKRPVSEQLVRFRRREQMQRLRKILFAH